MIDPQLLGALWTALAVLGALAIGGGLFVLTAFWWWRQHARGSIAWTTQKLTLEIHNEDSSSNDPDAGDARPDP